jgi:hypothetical protein
MRQQMSDFPRSNAATYQVYVMRIWLEQTVPPVWRFSLEDPNSGHQRGFSCLTELVAYLEDTTRYLAQNNIEKNPKER